MGIVFEGVSKAFGSVTALAPLDLAVPPGKFLALLGPSGCGKSTALRLLAGLEEPTSGRILVAGRDITRCDPRDRDVAMVFQSYALYPHKTVGQNIEYPLRLRKVEPARRTEMVHAVAVTLGLEALLDRTPRQLSGGQRQRVALARAMVREPQAFLMDEPLSNLDAQLRLQMRGEIKRLQRELGVTTVYVTHDQIEAMTMADLIAVMRDGELQQLATPAELYARPANLFVARFCGSPPMNVIEGEVADGAFVTRAGRCPLPAGAPRETTMLGFRPEHGELVARGEPGAFAGEVYLVEPLGNETHVSIRIAEDVVNLRLAPSFDGRAGDAVAVRPDPAHLHLFTAAGETVRPAIPEDQRPPRPDDALTPTHT